ncbi:MAG: hypothetical protein LUE13_03530, partial [Akkermansiaceae bacterium]|nr:hypothetical protein [Akkermansiaceae bacterium]
MDSRGRLLKNTFLSLGKCCYELHTGNGTFTLNLLLQDQFFPKDGRLHIKGNAILACARLDALPVQEIILQQGASYSIPLYIPPFAETGNDIANPETLHSEDISFHKSKKDTTWTIVLNHTVNF